MRAAASALCLLILVASAEARAQTCGLNERVLFPGHSLPLDTVPDPQPMSLSLAFPSLDPFALPVFLTAPPDGTNRLFVVEKGDGDERPEGTIRVFANRDDVQESSLFLTIDDVDSGRTEQGLLGMAFDPDYSTNRRFYVNYTSSTGCGNTGGEPWCSKIVRYETSEDDPDLADPGSATVLLTFAQPEWNHNGGMMAFGPDGMLYVAVGDGGEDLGTAAQDLSLLLGSLLRLDVSEGAALIPADNPFVDTPSARGEIYHYGLRNPWRFSFDRETGDLWIGDVGDGEREEVDFVPAGSAGGLNFGWPQCEGTRDQNGPCDVIVSQLPLLEYDHSMGDRSITGGYVYRGDRLPEINGVYLYADFVSRRFWAYDPVAAGEPELIATEDVFPSSFGEDRDGELYIVSFGGQIFQLDSSGGASDGEFPLLLSETGFFPDTANTIPAPGLIEFEITTPLWSDNAVKRRWLALPGARKIAFHATQAWGFPVGTALVKQFDLVLGGETTRLETRVLLRQTTRWAMVTYVWNEAQTDADLVTDGLDVTIDLGGSTQDWHYPSSPECTTCHTSAAGRVLGVRARQLGSDFDYPEATDSPLHTFNCVDLFDSDIREATRYGMYAPVTDAGSTWLRRSRSYFASNCSMCHQPLGSAPVDIDFRFDTALIDMELIDVSPSEGGLGTGGAGRRIKVGVSDQSIVYLRMESSDESIRMARGTLLPDLDALAAVESWIDTALTTLDSDEDTVPDDSDLCPTVPDPDQEDGDEDGIGDACDADALPDLSVASLSAPGQTASGAEVVLDIAVDNGGTAVGDFAVTVYLSADETLDPGVDASVGSCWIESLGAMGSGSCQTVSALVPQDLVASEPAQSFFWIACADRMDAVREGNDENNCMTLAETVLVPEPSAWLARSIALVTLALVSPFARRRARPRLESA